MEECEMYQAGVLEDEIRVQTLSTVILNLRHSRVRRVFPELRNIAIFSIYGRESLRWMKLRDLEDFVQRGNMDWVGVDACGKMWATYLALSHIHHICIRDGGGGPLAGHTTLYPHTFGSVNSLVPGLTIHFNEYLDKIDFRTGATTSWVSDIPSSYPWSEI